MRVISLLRTMFFLLTATQIVAGATAGTHADDKLPDAIVDLATLEGTKSVSSQWRTAPARIVEIDHREPGDDLKASGKPNRTHDVSPRAGAADFDDQGWETIEAATLNARRGGGRLSFQWYRVSVTLPEKIGAVDVRGATLVLNLTLDDYAEVWVDGELPQILGQSGGALIAGWNTPNRVVLRRDAKPGERVQLAIFAANGPLSDPPPNFVWIRSALLELYKPGRWGAVQPAKLEIDRRDAALDSILSADAQLERVATGFTFAEGPLWVPARVGGAGAQAIREGYLLFSDPNRNTIYRCTRDGEVSIYRAASGYRGADVADYRQPGSNGLALDARGRVSICEHGNRRVTRIEPNGVLTVLADRFDGKRLNSPNDLVYRSDGALFFTDPYFGLPKFADDPRREQPHAGVYSLVDGKTRLITGELSGPNGIAFSPDERHLYVGNWDDNRKIVMRYTVAADGSASDPQVFADMTSATGADAIDGVKVDARGNVFVSGPGGLWIFSPESKHLGTLRGPEHVHNLAWGDDDGRTLYLAAQTSIYRIRLRNAGAGRAAVSPTTARGN